MERDANSGREDPRVTHTRSEVHATVLRLLESEGPAGVTHARVVEASSVSRATLYRHWPDRTALLIDAIASERPEFDIDEPTGDFRRDLRAVLRAGATYMEGSHTIPWLFALSMGAADDPDLRVVFERIHDLHDTPLAPIHQRGIATGMIRDDIDPIVFQAMCFGTLYAMRFLWQRHLSDDLVDAVVDAILDGVRPQEAPRHRGSRSTEAGVDDRVGEDTAGRSPARHGS